MKYIIYSNGDKGYRCYYNSGDVSDAQINAINKLYIEGGIAVDDDTSERRGIRIASFSDNCYILSIIYRGCSGNGCSRKMFAGVNWLLDGHEMSGMFAGGYDNFISLFKRTDELLVKNKYNIPEFSEPAPRANLNYSYETKKILVSSVYSAFLGADNGAQSFVGYNDITEAYEMMFWLFKIIPQTFWKYLSIYVGAASAGETGLSYLVFMDNATTYNLLQRGFSGCPMMALKSTLYNGKLHDGNRLPKEVENFLMLGEKNLMFLKQVFSLSDDVGIFLNTVNCLSQATAKGVSLIALVQSLGDDLTVRCIDNGMLGKSDIVEAVINNRNAFSGHNKLLKLADEELALRKEEERKLEEKRKREEKRKLEEERKREEEQKKKKQSKKSDGKNSSKSTKTPQKTENVTDEKNVTVPPQEEAKKSSGMFAFVSSLAQQKSLLYAIIAILSLVVIIAVDVFAFDFAAERIAAVLKSVPVDKSILVKNYLFTIIGLNVVNIPVGFTFIASVLELFRSFYTDKRR